MDVAERFFSVNGYQLAALEWNAGAPLKVIALHGWLDNAASFSHLAPALRQCHVVALDLAGHGHSDHRPPQATYNLWDDLLDILAVADACEWQRFHLVGHSRGAMVSLLLSTAVPDRVNSLVMLDGLVPQPVQQADIAIQMAKFLQDSRKQSARPQRGYESIARAVQLRCKAIGMLQHCAEPIVERALAERDGRYFWRSDSRLKNASAVKLSDQQNRALLQALAVPHRLVVSSRGLGAWDYFLGLAGDYPELDPVTVEGSHHFHMEEDLSRLVDCLDQFYRPGSVRG